VSSAPLLELIDVLERVRRLLLLSGNDFVYSQWDDAEAAIRDIDGFIQTLQAGRLPPRLDMSILFAPTGSIQEVSVRSGWGDEFLKVASQFDDSEAKAYGHAAAG
jgi:hypothetical protein